MRGGDEGSPHRAPRAEAETESGRPRDGEGRRGAPNVYLDTSSMEASNALDRAQLFEDRRRAAQLHLEEAAGSEDEERRPGPRRRRAYVAERNEGKLSLWLAERPQD